MDKERGCSACIRLQIDFRAAPEPGRRCTPSSCRVMANQPAASQAPEASAPEAAPAEAQERERELAKRRVALLGASIIQLRSLCWCPVKSTLSRLGRACPFPRKSRRSPPKPMQEPHCRNQRPWFRIAGPAKPMSSGEISAPNPVSRANVPTRATSVETARFAVPSRIITPDLPAPLLLAPIAGRVRRRLKPRRSPSVSSRASLQARN